MQAIFCFFQTSKSSFQFLENIGLPIAPAPNRISGLYVLYAMQISLQVI
jgi:hypothetical protein